MTHHKLFLTQLFSVVVVILFFIQVDSVHAATRTTSSREFILVDREIVSALVVTPRTHQTLFALEPDQIQPAASLTKLVSSLVVVKMRITWDGWVRLTKADEVGGGRLRVRSGTRVRSRDLLISSIAGSANNAANALARVTGLSDIAFAKRMNRLVTSFGATHSQFVDASGIDPRNITTARDMVRIAEQAFHNKRIRQAAIVGTHRFYVQRPNHWKTIHNTNKLLVEDEDVWVVGGKTGYLEESKYHYVVQLMPVNADGQPDEQKEIIVVVLGAETKEASFRVAKRLAAWAWDAYAF